MAGTTPSKTDAPVALTADQLAAMAPEDLAALIAGASKIQAEREREQRLATALATVGDALAEISFDEVAAAAAESDAPAVITGLTAIVMKLNQVKSGVMSASGLPSNRPATGGTGNGNQRASRIRDEIAGVFAEHPDQDFSVAELATELPPAPTGNKVSSGAVQVALMGADGNGGMVAAGSAVITQDSPRRFKGVTPTAPITEAK